MLPATLKGFSFFADGRGYLGLCTAGTPPKITIKTEEHRDGGMDGAVELDMGMEKLELGAELAEYNGDAMALVGLLNAGTQVTLRGSMEAEDGTAVAIEHTGVGLFKESDGGEWKPGSSTSLKLTSSLRYYKLTVGGVVTHEIDLINCIRIVNGVDQLAARRSALGI